jgi:hypothetical protein
VVKKISLAGVLVLLLIPLTAGAYRFGVGGYTSILSHGAEFTFWTNQSGPNQLFISPHGFGVYYFDDEEGNVGNGFYTIGLKTGIMWSTDRWISPSLGIGGGYTLNAASDSESKDYGARLFTGLSFAPFDPLSANVSWLSWARVIKGLRFTFETGVKYHYRYYYDERTDWINDTQQQTIITENEEAKVSAPDFGFGISFNW